MNPDEHDALDATLTRLGNQRLASAIQECLSLLRRTYDEFGEVRSQAETPLLRARLIRTRAAIDAALYAVRRAVG